MPWIAAVAAPIVSSMLAPSPSASAPGVNPAANLPGQGQMASDLYGAIAGAPSYPRANLGGSVGAQYPGMQYPGGGTGGGRVGIASQPSLTAGGSMGTATLQGGSAGGGMAGVGGGYADVNTPFPSPQFGGALTLDQGQYGGYQTVPYGGGSVGPSQNQLGYMGMANRFAGMDPAYANQAFQAMYGNPYAGGMQSAAGQAGAMAGQFAPYAALAGMGALGAGQQALGAGQQAYQTAFDPQQALYNQMQNQVQQQSAVTGSMYGLGGSPAGAAAANQALGQFDINWQNQQLARQLQGQQALNAGIGAYTSAAQQGLGLGATGIALQQQAGALPYQTAQAIGQGQFGAIGANQAAMQGAMQQYQQYINNMNAYLGLGQAAQAQSNQQAYQQQLLQQQQIAGLSQLGTQIATQYMGNPSSTSTQPLPSGGMTSTGSTPAGNYWGYPSSTPSWQLTPSGYPQ